MTHFQLPEEEEVLGMTGPERNMVVTPRQGLFQFSMFFVGILALYGIVNMWDKPERVAVRRQYPYDGLSNALGGFPVMA